MASAPPGVKPPFPHRMPRGDTSTATTTIAIITCGRIAPCFGPAVGGFLQRYGEVLGSSHLHNPKHATAGSDGRAIVRLIAYRHGFRGLLRGDVIEFGPEHIAAAPLLAAKGGSPIGASRTRLSNMAHLRLRGLIADGDDDAHEVAARRLKADNVAVLHVIGSSHAQLTGQRLSAILREKHGHFMRSIGLAKTIENDMYPIQMTLGALTAAEHGAIYFENVVPEHNSNPRMLIIHEIKGRAAGCARGGDGAGVPVAPRSPPAPPALSVVIRAVARSVRRPRRLHAGNGHRLPV